ncbi:unnamed protein product [Closterium sp. Naga37s-1]|nr:unnamed protein product [Closterium sp. Naga37s-1]
MLYLFPQTFFPQTFFPQTLFPQTLFPQTLFPQTLFPQTLFPQTLIPQTLDPQTSFSKPSLQFSDAAEVQLAWTDSSHGLSSVSAALTLPFPASFSPAPHSHHSLQPPHSLRSTRDDGTAEVQLGSTRVLASVSAALTLPFPDRPNEGSLAVFTELAPMADPRFVPGRPGEDAIELGRIIDRGLRESHAVDTESLCVVAGRAAWALRLDIRVMDNDGNLVDACCLAAVAALLAFRRPEVTVGGDDGMQVVVHSVEERDPIPLTVHNLPLAVSFAFFNDGNDVVMDPSYKEEAAQAGRCTVLVNAVGDVCSVQKGGGVGVSLPQLMRCSRVAASVAQHMIKTLTDKVAALAAERQRRKVKRHASPAAAAAAATVGLDTAAGGSKAGVIGVAEIAAVQKKGGGVRQGQAGADGGGGGVKEEQMEEGGEEEEGEEESSDGEDGDEEEEEEGEGDKGRGGAAGGGVDALFEGGVSSWLQEEGGEKKSKKGPTAGDASSHPPLILLLSSHPSLVQSHYPHRFTIIHTPLVSHSHPLTLVTPCLPSPPNQPLLHSPLLPSPSARPSARTTPAHLLPSELDAIADLLPSTAALHAPVSKASAVRAMPPAGKGKDEPSASAAEADAAVAVAGAGSRVKEEPLTLADAVKKPKKKKKSKAEQ